MMIICFPLERKFTDSWIYTRWTDGLRDRLITIECRQSWDLINGYIITYTCNSNSVIKAQKVIFPEKVFKQNRAYIVLIHRYIYQLSQNLLFIYL